jgi:hypothetical protein
MVKLVAALLGLYLGLALLGRGRERSGDITCGCSQACWCKRPGLSLFRWVFPIGHRGFPRA